MLKRNNKKVSILFSVLFSVSLVIVPMGTWAAVLYFEPSSGEYYQEDIFIVKVKIDTENECINTVGADIEFPKDILEAINFSQGSSILNIWVKPPSILQEMGLISFIGGIPGGYCGMLPGEPGESNILGKIVFQVRKTDAKLERETDAKLEFLDTCQVLLNDGFGTPAKLTTKPAVFKITGVEPLQLPKDEWQKELEKDNIPPEPFEIEIHQTPEIFEGKYFIIFLTTDKQTGIDHYEIAEQRGILRGITRKIEWKRAESPYLLEDQGLESIIKVKAVDKSGNERIAEYLPPYKITWKDVLPWIILILVGVGVIWWLIKSRNRRKTLRKTDAKI